MICKFVDPVDGKAYYMEWDNPTDSPGTWGMSLEDFLAFSREEYGRVYCETEWQLPARLLRVEEKGTSSRLHDSLDELLERNRAGKNEGWLSKEQIIEAYCRNRDKEKIPDGIPLHEKYPELDED